MIEAYAILTHLTLAQRKIVREAPIGGDWFPVTWEGWGGLWLSLQRIGLTYPRELGSQTLSPLGLAVRSCLLK